EQAGRATRRSLHHRAARDRPAPGGAHRRARRPGEAEPRVLRARNPGDPGGAAAPRGGPHAETAPEAAMRRTRMSLSAKRTPPYNKIQANTRRSRARGKRAHSQVSSTLTPSPGTTSGHTGTR